MVAVLNEFAERIEAGGAQSFEAAFAELLDRMRHHFAHEEAHMDRLNFPGLDWHRAHHREILETCLRLRDQCRAAGQASTRVVQDCFDQVMSEVARADLKFREFLVSRGYLRE